MASKGSKPRCQDHPHQGPRKVGAGTGRMGMLLVSIVPHVCHSGPRTGKVSVSVLSCTRKRWGRTKSSFRSWQILAVSRHCRPGCKPTVSNSREQSKSPGLLHEPTSCCNTAGTTARGAATSKTRVCPSWDALRNCEPRWGGRDERGMEGISTQDLWPGVTLLLFC